MKEPNSLIGRIAHSCRHGVMVMRDQGMLYQIEKKFRPLMTAEKKTQFSSQDLERELTVLAIPYKKSSFVAKMAVPAADKSEFAQLAGFLLDLQAHELKPELFQKLYQDMNVKDGFASYGIDMLWFQGQGK
jgi:hypothetical protein